MMQNLSHLPLALLPGQSSPQSGNALLRGLSGLQALSPAAQPDGEAFASQLAMALEVEPEPGTALPPDGQKLPLTALPPALETADIEVTAVESDVALVPTPEQENVHAPAVVPPPVDDPGAAIPVTTVPVPATPVQDTPEQVMPGPAMVPHGTAPSADTDDALAPLPPVPQPAIDRAVPIEAVPAGGSLSLTVTEAGRDPLQRFAEQWSRRTDLQDSRLAERAHPERGMTLAAMIAGNQPAASTPAPGGAELMMALQQPASAAGSPPAAAGQTQSTAGALLHPAQPGPTSQNGGNPPSAAVTQSASSPDSMAQAQRSLMDGSGIVHNAVREQWGDALSRRIQMMTAQQRSEAHIRLDPPELGRLMIQLQMNAEQLSIQFASPHALVREALESSLPRLQEALAADGLDLLDVDISDQAGEDAGQSDEDPEQPGDSPAGSDDDPSDAAGRHITATALSLVDAYA